MANDFDLALARRFDGIGIAVGWVVRDRFEHGVSDPLLVVGRCADGWFVQSMSPHPGERPRSFFAAAHSLVIDYTDPGTLGHVVEALRKAWPIEAATLAAAWEGRHR